MSKLVNSITAYDSGDIFITCIVCYIFLQSIGIFLKGKKIWNIDIWGGIISLLIITYIASQSPSFVVDINHIVEIIFNSCLVFLLMNGINVLTTSTKEKGLNGQTSNFVKSWNKKWH